MKLLKWFFICCLVVFLNNVEANKTDHEHEHDHEDEHDHDSHDENAFYNLVEAITGEHLHAISDEAAMKLIETLERRFHIDNTECLEKIKAELLQDKVNEYNETTFIEPSITIIQLLSYGSCEYEQDHDHDHDHDHEHEESPICRYQVNEVIRKMKLTYEVYTATICFNEYTLMESNCTTDSNQVVYSVLLNLYNGNCILPSSSDVVDSLFHHIGVEGDVVTDANFDTLLSSLQIGTNSASDEHEGHDHGEEENHDDHDHARKRRDTEESEEEHDHSVAACFNENQLRSIYGHFGNMSREQTLEMCPVFLEQIVGGYCSSSTTSEDSTTSAYYTTAMKFGYGTLAVAIITLLALVGIIFFPIIDSAGFHLAMQFFMALGVGTMSGDAIFHILPDILGLHNHGSSAEHDHEEEENQDYIWKLLVVVAAIWVMFIFENALKVLTSKQHDHSYNMNETSICSAEGVETYENKVATGKSSDRFDQVEKSSVGKKSDISTEPSSTSKTGKTYFWGISISGVMVFLGDVLCNLGDGLAIGAAFSYSWPQGIGTTLAVAFHELPHEFADFAIYIYNGLSKGKAVLLNVFCKCCCFVGLYIGLALSEDPGVRTWILTVVAGNFIYISLVIVALRLKDNVTRNPLRQMVERKTKNPKMQFALQNLGLFIGWTILFLLSVFEEALITSIQ